jgi:hypothetical protein
MALSSVILGDVGCGRGVHVCHYSYKCHYTSMCSELHAQMPLRQVYTMHIRTANGCVENTGTFCFDIESEV